MLPNAFIGKAEPPGAAELAAALGPTAPLWERLVADLGREHGIVDLEWHSYSRKVGWAAKLKKGDRTILYLAPCGGSFRASFALGDKAVAAAKESKLPAAVLKLIAEARRYAEGTAVRIDVKKAGDVAVVMKLAVIKMEH